jgi:hypothetical protein
MFAARQGFYSQPVVAGNVRRTGTLRTLSTTTFDGQNGANFSTTRSAFGAGSLDLEANNKTISRSVFNTAYTGGTAGGYPSSTGDFCIEGWIWVPAARSRTATGCPIALNITNGLAVRFGPSYNGGSFNWLSIFRRGQADLDRAPITWPNETWCHWAVQRKNSVISLWANGNKLARQNGPSGTGATYSFTGSTSTTVVLGSYQPNTTDETMKCWMDEVCVSTSWRYDDAENDYVVPTAPFAVDEYTGFILHFDSNLTTAAT